MKFNTLIRGIVGLLLFSQTIAHIIENEKRSNGEYADDEENYEPYYYYEDEDEYYSTVTEIETSTLYYTTETIYIAIEKPTKTAQDIFTPTSEPVQPATIITCNAENYGYPCCSHCHSIYEDDTGLWGSENGEWCGIADQCQQDYESCWSVKFGYPCCDHCDLDNEDESGRWGISDGQWCGLPTSC